MKKLLLLICLFLLAGCQEKDEVEQVNLSSKTVTVTKDDDDKSKDIKKDEKEPETIYSFSEVEVESFKLKLIEIEANAVKYLNNTRSDIYVCAKLCVDQPLTDIQLSIDVSRNGLMKASQQMADIVPEIKSFANSNSPGIIKADMQRVADQFQSSSLEIQSLLNKKEWLSWEEPGEIIDGILANLEETSQLYKPYSPGINEEEAKALEDDTNISAAIVGILGAREELHYQYSNLASIAAIEPERENDDGVAFAQPYFFENHEQELETIIQSAQQALTHQPEENLRQEFEDSILSAESLKASIYEYNVIVESYGSDYSYDSTMENWYRLNQALEKIALNLEFKTYEMEMNQDFSNL